MTDLRDSILKKYNSKKGTCYNTLDGLIIDLKNGTKEDLEETLLIISTSFKEVFYEIQK